VPDFRDLFSLSGQTVLITGGAGGIGRAIANGVAQFGAGTIVVADRDFPAAREVALQLASDGYKAEAVLVDVTDAASVRLMVEETTRASGRIDTLVNCAGVNLRKMAVELSEEEYDRILDVNLKGTFLCCQAAGRVMLRLGRGKIINLGSVSSVLGHPHHAPYAASKGGVALLTKALAVEWARSGITVNAICPAYIQTGLTAGYLAQADHMQKIVRTIPMGRLGTPEDVVGAVVYLASKASDFVTGALLFVDGGRTAD
jgi:NAD(P)-dependent dehydrogenase (short-subunit alcohol dehydrogenase family)